MNYLITYFPEFKKVAYREVLAVGGKIERDFESEFSLISTEDGFIDRLLKSDSIFIRHIMPVQSSVFLLNDREKALNTILENVKEIISDNKLKNFSVQTRIVAGESDYNSKDIEVFVGSYFDGLGGTPVFSDFGLIENEVECSIISIFIYRSEVFIGISNANENLNFHSNEYRILSRKGKEQSGKSRSISRAEFKLIEAIHKFKINIQGSGYALDIGASPGGWSKVLADYGFMVYAVDPGDLNVALNNYENIRHFKSKIEELNFEEKFEIVVNDMNVDPQQSARMMNKLVANLEHGAYAILTLKLPFSDVDRSISESVEILKEEYEVISLKNLFHNRQEITAYLRKKN